MDPYQLIAFLLTLSVFVGYVNHRFIKMPGTIAVMVSSLVISCILLFLKQWGFTGIVNDLSNALVKINFHDLLINGMLGFLLFAGALTIDFSHLKNRKWEIGVLATLGTMASTVLVGILMYFILECLNVHLSFLYCFLFGALISPTDPIAVLSIFRDLKAPKEMRIFLEGESLFNDGVGIVIFMTLYAFAFQQHSFSLMNLSLLFFQEALGGIIYGLLLGFLGYWLMKPLQDHRMQILVTLALVMGGYSLAMMLNISGPLAMVVAGIMLGHGEGVFSLSSSSRKNLDIFWELVDEILNAMLFLLIGFELLQLTLGLRDIIAMGVAVVVVLFVRALCVALPVLLFKLKLKRTYYPKMIQILIWGGLRGGLAVALALALPIQNESRTLILSMTYGVVVFSILVQGLTVKPMIEQSLKKGKEIC